MLVSKTSGRGSIPRGPAVVHNKSLGINQGFYCVASKLLCLRTSAGGGDMLLQQRSSRGREYLVELCETTIILSNS